LIVKVNFLKLIIQKFIFFTLSCFKHPYEFHATLGHSTRKLMQQSRLRFGQSSTPAPLPDKGKGTAPSKAVTGFLFSSDADLSAEQKAKRDAAARSTVYYDAASNAHRFVQYHASPLADGRWVVKRGEGREVTN
jgi:hypothetical protein